NELALGDGRAGGRARRLSSDRRHVARCRDTGARGPHPSGRGPRRWANAASGRVPARERFCDRRFAAIDGMTALSLPAPIREVAAIDFARFHDEIRPANEPVVMRGVVRDWPAVASALESDQAIVDYLIGCGPRKPIGAIAARPEEEGRFFYNT